MSDTNKKSPLEEAKFSYEQIQKFAEEQAAEQMKEQVSKKLKALFEEKLNEDITININGEEVDVQKDGESIASLSDMGSEEMGLGNAETTFGDESHNDDEQEFMVSDEDDEIAISENGDFDFEENGVKYGKDYLPKPAEELNLNIDENMYEMNEEEAAAAQAAAAPAAPVAADPTAVPTDVAPAGITPVEEAPAMPDLLAKLDSLINIMLQQQGGAAPVDGGAVAGTEDEFEVIDDEAGAPAGAAPAAPVADPNMAPAMEEEFEIEDFDEEKNFIDEMEGQMLEIVEDEDADAIEETRSLGFTSKRTGDKTLKMDTMEKNKGHHAPVTSLKESKEDKAQKESIIDGLIKENSSLKSTIKSLQGKEKEFEDAFVDLRTQFNEMQLFNGKLALVNKVLMNGGLTTDEKVKVCEQFDNAQTYEEASKLFKNIIKENNIKVVGDKDKLKGASTNTVKPRSTSEPLYESTEARRAKVLAGMIKSEDSE